MNLKNQIYCGDNADLIKSIPDESIDLTVTSPPYDNLRNYNGFDWDFETLAKELYRVTKDGGVVVWVVNDSTVDGSETGTSFRQALFFKDECGFKLHDTMIYHKATGRISGSVYAYWQSFEYMFVLVKGRIKTANLIKDIQNKNHGILVNGTDRQSDGKLKRISRVVLQNSIRRNVWKIKTGNDKSSKDKIAYKHPAIFPEALARDHILSWSNPGDLVFDPFTGSGTTLKMAMQCNRYYLGFEISQEYIDIANERLRQKCLFN